jgi:hypothetical protein
MAKQARDFRGKLDFKKDPLYIYLGRPVEYQPH